MERPDAAVVSQLALRCGILKEHQIAEAFDELGQSGSGPSEPFLRLCERKGYLTPWQTSKLIKGDGDGYFLGGYRMLYKIASGSFGRVYRCDDPATGRIVAIKVLRRRWSEDQGKINLFEREGKMGLQMRHPNIVEILNVNQDPASGQWFIVMEFVEGGNLREILAIRKKLEPVEALRILEDATQGVAYAYAHGVTHRDMKLTNVLISAQGAAKIVDFGLAGMFTSLAMVPDKSEKQERTVDYAGLERATGVKAGDVRSDIYFLGCVVYEMLTGRSPILMTKDRHARMQKQRFDNVEPMKKEEVNGPPSLFHLVETMMSLDAQRRYQTPAQLLDAIKAVRQEVEGKVTGTSGPSKSVFVVESDDRLQQAIRDKFKELGYRVFMSTDPIRALDRYRQKPYDGLVMDVGTVGEDALDIFTHIMSESVRQELMCVGIVILAQEQAGWVKELPNRKSVAVLTRPVTLKQLYSKLQELLPTNNGVKR
jgi:serine/threonine protein kinase